MNKQITQAVEVNAERELIFEELLRWGESEWWPQGSLMRFTNLSGKAGLATVYQQKVSLPFGPSWHTRNEVVQREQGYIRRVFLDGMFSGDEEIKLVSQGHAYKVVYIFNGTVKGALNQLLWNIVFRNAHIKNLDLILWSLKQYVESKKTLSKKV